MIRFDMHLLAGFLVLFMLIPVSARSDSSSTVSEQEIAHLLQFVEHSGCTYIRNNVSYDSVRAREHIQKKFNYVKKRKKLVSAEQFITYAASRSSLSKKVYMVGCGTETFTSESWLTEELEKYRHLSEPYLSSESSQ